MELTVSEKIRLLCKREEITLSELSKRTNQTIQNLINKLRKDNFTIHQLEDISNALGYELKIDFVKKTTSNNENEM